MRLGAVSQFVSGNALAASEVIKLAANAVRLMGSTPQNQLKDRGKNVRYTCNVSATFYIVSTAVPATKVKREMV